MTTTAPPIINPIQPDPSDDSEIVRIARAMQNATTTKDALAAVDALSPEPTAAIHVAGFGTMSADHIKKDIVRRLRHLLSDAENGQFEQLHTTINGGVLFEEVAALKRSPEFSFNSFQDWADSTDDILKIRIGGEE